MHTITCFAVYILLLWTCGLFIKMWNDCMQYEISIMVTWLYCCELFRMIKVLHGTARKIICAVNRYSWNMARCMGHNDKEIKMDAGVCVCVCVRVCMILCFRTADKKLYKMIHLLSFSFSSAHLKDIHNSSHTCCLLIMTVNTPLIKL